MTREEKEQTGKYVLQMARLLEDGCYQQEMLLKAVHIIDEALEQEPTTKNDLGVDCISRQEVLRLLANSIGKSNTHLQTKVLKMSSVPPQEPRWIPVSDPPDYNKLVLTYIDTGVTKTYFLALRNEYYDDWEEGVGGSRLLGKDLGYKVLAWMPLPAPYEPQESEK